MEKLFKDIEKKSLVRVSTAGSVDDGKSTLIGRLLFDCNALMKDQIVNLENSSNNYGYEKLNLAYITDGLRSEREKAITIDVAYRYFSTKKCKFILADTPGHFEYTRNMVTGASLADILLLVLDINSGITNQTKRHLKLASLLRISNVTVCINKMDLVSYDKNLFEKISVQLKQLAFSLVLMQSILSLFLH
ncbi:MAG: 50S ribosome-binding GTPase [Saprospiraceae bacterium]|nr:50S ribosome-binding GTPase [Saprospiraceae bacterium]